MQQLLTGQRRFQNCSKKWEMVFLGDIAKITTGSSNRQDSTLEGEYTFFDRSEDIRSSDRYLFDGEAIIVPGEGQDFIPKYFVGKFDLHQRTYAIMDFPTCDGKYLFYAIHYFRAHFLSQAVGSTVKSLRLPMFQKMKLHLPTLAEQKKIASILSCADQEIELLQQKLHHLKQEKKALVQQLLTGKRRVNMEVA
ncbi:TPA: restriction endonuclease subunit S [Citrobacter koseri]|nr:restriction endonuclease subunit S [Citrobacter koseri]